MKKVAAAAWSPSCRWTSPASRSPSPDNMRSVFNWFLIAVAFVAFLAVSGAFYIVSEKEKVILTQFGEPVGGVVDHAGLHFKVPFIQEVNRFDKRVLQWDGP